MPTFLLLSVLFFSPFVWAGEALWTHQFGAESGFPVNLAQNSTPEQKTLVMFWASWCLPCKGELSDLAKRNQEIPSQLRIVAVNVDDPSGLPLAQAFLASIRWPYQVLRDNSGQFFYEYNRSQQLPFSVLLDGNGRELKSFSKLSNEDIAEILTTAAQSPAPGATSSAPEKKGVNTEFGFHTEAVDFSGDNNVRNHMATFTSFGRVDTDHWSALADYDFMYQEKSNPRAIDRGDEIGYSYLEYHSSLGKGRAQVRLGDTHEAILAGELLSLQNIPNLTDPASLRGVSAQVDLGDWSLLGYGGEIHPALFASPINPTTDLALQVPGERANGASLFWHHEGLTRKTQVNVNYVNYHRNVNLSLGLASPVDDDRWGAEFYHSSGKSGVQVRAAHFNRNTGVAGVDAQHPYIVDPYFWFSVPGLDHEIFTIHYIEYQSLPTRTLTPVLVENPALPLQAAKIRSFRLGTKFFNDAESIWFEPIWIFEEAFDVAPYERQNSYGFNLSLPKSDRKVLAFFQDGQLSPTSEYQETSLLGTSPIYGPLSVQILLRHHKSNLLSGDSDGINLGLDLSRLWHLPFKGKFLFTNQWTRQSGYYFGFSGISRTDLFSSHLEWSQGLNTIRIGVGGEPGGIVCTNGVCVQKPPLNGADIEVAFSF
jgi:thiol-disulfide isomerase/thioredoxin